MNQLVKFIVNDDGEQQEPLWHVVDINNGSGASKLCTGEYFDGSTDVVYEEKLTLKGGLTCPECINAVKNIKAIRL